MPTLRTRQPSRLALPGLSVLSYGTSTAMPIGISLDRKTVYGAAASGTATTLYQSTNDGAAWTTVTTFAENVRGLIELDDGEALAFTQATASTPGYIYRSSGWPASHTTATWTKVLTTVGGYLAPRWNAHAWTFGDDTIRDGSSAVGIVAEYGTQTPNASYGSRIYTTTNYGAAWTQVLDIAERWPGVNPLHTHSAAYDPYWDRMWVLYGDTQAGGTSKAMIAYSDDRGASWDEVPMPAEWAMTSGFGFQSTGIAVLRDCILIGSDNHPGFVRLPRKGYRALGDIQTQMVVAGGTATQMIVNGAHQNRRQPGAPLLMGWQSQQIYIDPGIAVSLDGGATLTRLWADATARGSGGSGRGVNTVFGPTYNGVILAHVSQPGSNINWMLRGELVVPDAGMLDGYATVTGDGTTTSFSFPHGLPAQPSRYLAWPEKPVTGTYTVTATATNIVVTFATAPAAAAAIPFQWRAAA